MVIVLRLTAGDDRVDLEDPEDLRRFHVRVEGAEDPTRIAAAFESTGLGDFQSIERAMVRVAKVRSLAQGRVSARWEDDLDGMLAYAATKGWYDTGAGTIQAHCEISSSG